MSKLKKSVILKIEGEKIKIPFDKLQIDDIDKSMSRIASKMGYYGTLLAKAEKEAKLAENQYRAWRARQGKIITPDKKMSEWKVNQELNSDPNFIKLKEAIATAEFNVTVLIKYFEALKANAFILPSKGARTRSEISSQGMVTKTKKRS